MRLAKVDLRAIAIGAVVGAPLVSVAISGDGAKSTVIVFGIFAALPAGVAVGIATRGYQSHLLEGGLAAIGAPALALLGHGLLEMALATDLPLGYRVDVLFVASVYRSWILLVVGIPAFFLGGIVARRTRSHPLVARRIKGE